MLKDIWHTSFTVSNLEKSLDFYCNILGFEVVHRQEQANTYTSKFIGYENAHLKVAMLKLPNQQTGVSGHTLELIEYVHPKGPNVDVSTCNAGSAHMAFVVDDMAKTYTHFKRKGVRFKSEPVLIEEGRNKGGYAVYFLDPDNITLELVQPPMLHK